MKNPRWPAKAEGEGGRFETEFEKLAAPLTKFIIKHVAGDGRATEEVLSDTMVAAWHGWTTFKHKSSYFTWLCRIALNKIADYYRAQVNERSRVVVPLIEAITKADPKNLSPEESLALKELRASVNDCLNLLPYEKRRLLWFKYWKDYSYEKIAEILGVSERAIEGRLYRAKEEFSKLWDRNF